MLRIRRRGRAGMTMIEVSVVTGILATLAGQSGSAFMQAKNKSLGTQCESNLKQIYMAVQMWADTNDGAFPRAWFFPWKGTQDENGVFQLDPNDAYNIVNIIAGRDTSIRKLFICPGAPEPWQRLGITYVYNDTLSGKLLDTVPNPSLTWLLMDANIVNQQKFPAPHLAGHNVLFCDGHVKWVPQAQVPAVFRAGLQGQMQQQ